MTVVQPSEERRFFWNLFSIHFLGRSCDLFKIPGPPAFWGLGHIPYLIRPDYHVQVLQWANKYGGICRFQIAGQPIVVVTDPVVAGKVLGRGAEALPRKSLGYEYFDLATNPLGLQSFFSTSNEEQWALVRKSTAQAFSQTNIRRYFMSALKHAQELSEQVKMASKTKGMQVEIQEHLEMMLLDVFLEGLFEMDLRRINSEEVSHAMNLVLEEANERIKNPFRRLYVGFVNPRLSWQVSKNQGVLGNLYEKIFNAIRSRGMPPDDETLLWACLARIKDPKTGKLLNKEQMLPEIGAFIMAGFDTSSHTIAWCLFTIASRPDIQQKIKEELKQAGLMHKHIPNCIQPRQLAYEDLPRLRYLNCVIDETMRMYPVAATGSVRETTAKTQVGQYVIPEGVVVWPMIYGLQNSKNNWEEPEKFMPERWFEKNVAYDPSTGARRFLPFSDGVKSCLGQALGIMEVRTVLAILLSRFWFDLAPSMGTPEQVHKHMKIALTLKMRTGLKLLCKPHEA